MTGGDRSDPPTSDSGEDAEDLRDLARDWITLWQSELSALAVDREAQEAWHLLLSLWAGTAAGMINALPRGGPDDPAGSGARRGGHAARAAAAPRPAAAAAAPDPRDAE